MVLTTSHQVAAEAHHIDLECSRKALAHDEAANIWSKSHYLIGVPSAVMAAGAAAVVLSGFQYSAMIAAGLAILVSALTTSAMVLNPKDKVNAHQLASARFEALHNQARILQKIDARLQDDSALAVQLKDLTQRQNDLILSSPGIGQWAKRRARVLQMAAASTSPGVEVLSLKNVAEVYAYVASRIEASVRSVDDITWGSRKDYRTKDDLEAYGIYLQAVRSVCERGTVKYREVSSLTDDHYFRRSIDLVKEGHYSYHLGYYDTSSVNIPLISYVIIDENEAILGFYRAPVLSIDEELYLRVTDPVTLSLFVDYFETLWTGSTKLKEGDTIDWDAIRSLCEHLGIPEEYLEDVKDNPRLGG